MRLRSTKTVSFDLARNCVKILYENHVVTRKMIRDGIAPPLPINLPCIPDVSQPAKDKIFDYRNKQTKHARPHR